MDEVSREALSLADYDIALPFVFSITVEDKCEQVICNKLLRILPGRRLVLAAVWREQPVAVKIFYRRQEYLAELDGHQALLTARLSTAAILTDNWADNSGIIVYQWLSAPGLEEVWRQSDENARLGLIKQVATLLATMHEAGLCQQDLHLNNFLYDRVCHVLDAGSISAHKEMKTQERLDNLALLLSQLPPRCDDAIDGVFASYRAHSSSESIADDAALLPLLKAMTVARRKKRWQHYQAKLTRTCTEFGVAQRFRRFSVWRRDHEPLGLIEALENLDELIDQGEWLKKGNSATVVRIKLQDQTFVIKRYNIKNWRHAISRCWRSTRAWVSWHNAYRLRFNGIETPLPIAMVEERVGWLRSRAYIISQSVSGEDLLTRVGNNPQDTALVPPCLYAMTAELFMDLCRAGLSHGDMKATNILMTEQGLSLIDLDSMQHHAVASQLSKALEKDCDRFLRNWQGNTYDAFNHSLALFREHLQRLGAGL